MENSLKLIKYEKVNKNLEEMYSFYNNDAKLSLIAKMASISSAIKKEFEEFTFVGFYIIVNLDKENSNEKVLEIGPYVSHILATPRIYYGKGVCGTSWEEKQTQIVNNVRKCNNYIACSPDVLSEIVVPVIHNDEVIAVLDIDCKILDRFDEVDKEQLENLMKVFC